jgi:peptide chain release factor 1
LSDAQLNWRLFDGAHSIAEYLYHVAGVELYWAHHLGGWQPADDFEAGVLQCTCDSFLNEKPFPLPQTRCNATDAERALRLAYEQLAPIIESPTPEQLAKPVRSPIGDPIDGREGLIRVCATRGVSHGANLADAHAPAVSRGEFVGSAPAARMVQFPLMLPDKLRAKLTETLAKLPDIEAQLADPAVLSDPSALQRLGKQHAELTELRDLYTRYQQAEAQLREATQILEADEDPDLIALAHDERETAQKQLEEYGRALTARLLPRDPNDERNVIMEIRPAAGGEEAALFAGDLARMYMRFAERKGWRYELMDAEPSDLGGYKYIVFSIQGDGAYSQLKHESGVHRVQRVPVTESGGRIHTSTATVAVLPEAEEVDVSVNPQDLVIETYRSSGPGGQHMQKNETAVRITHKPTGLVVACQDERSQLQNRERAMRILRARLYEMEQERLRAERDQQRRTQIGTGERSEKIRTYNFPDQRITDHRIGLTLHDMQGVLDGDLQPFIDALQAEEQARKLEALEIG